MHPMPNLIWVRTHDPQIMNSTCHVPEMLMIPSRVTNDLVRNIVCLEQSCSLSDHAITVVSRHIYIYIYIYISSTTLVELSTLPGCRTADNRSLLYSWSTLAVHTETS